MWNCEELQIKLDICTPAHPSTYDVFEVTGTWEVKSIEVSSFVVHVIQCPAKKRDGPGCPSGGIPILYNSKLLDVTCKRAEDDNPSSADRDDHEHRRFDDTA